MKNLSLKKEKMTLSIPSRSIPSRSIQRPVPISLENSSNIISDTQIGDNLLSLKVPQTVPFQTYTPGTCGCQPNLDSKTIPCDPGDIQIGLKKCCGRQNPPQPICSKIDSSVCPSFNNTRPMNVSWTMEHVNQGENVPMITCLYNREQIKTTEDIQQWISLNGKDSQLNEKILPLFCNQSVSTCPIDPTTDKPMSQCNRLVSTGEDGNICRDWANTNPDLRNQLVDDYCLKNNTPDCLCFHREDITNSTYKNLSRDISAPPNCWYRPCMDQNTYLVPGSMLNNTNCPSDTCDQVNRAYQTESSFVRLDDASDITMCPLVPPKIASFGLSFWFIVLLIIIIVILIGIIIYLYMKTQQKEIK